MKRLLRAVARPFKRLVRPLRLRCIDWQREYSAKEVERLLEMRDDLMQLEQYEKLRQVKLELRRSRIERGHA